MIPFGEWLQQLITQFLDYLKPWVLIDQFEAGVLLRCGRYNRTLYPGLHLKWPFLDYYHSAIVTIDTLEVNEVNITTLDGQTISIGCYIEYLVIDVRKFLLDVNDAKTNMKDICRGILSNHLEDVTWEDIKKKPTINAIRKKLTSKYAEMGVEVKDVMFTDKCKSRVFKLFSGGSIHIQNGKELL